MFIEILNFHSHSNRSVNIYVKEMTTVYLSQTQNYIVNMSEVSMDTYTDTTRTPEMANIFASDIEKSPFTSGTIMNLVVNPELRLFEKLNHGFCESELQQVEIPDGSIYLIRTNFNINNFEVKRDIDSDKNKQTTFVKPIYLQHKTVSFTN